METYSVPESCPKCGHMPITEIIYGLIRKIPKDLQRDIQSTRKRLGGCMVDSKKSPAYGCLQCGYTVSMSEANHPTSIAIEKMLEEMDAKRQERENDGSNAER